MAGRLQCLCTNCSKKCDEFTRSELALNKTMTYIYLHNGTKVTNSCRSFTIDRHRVETLPQPKLMKNPMPTLFPSLVLDTLKF